MLGQFTTHFFLVMVCSFVQNKETPYTNVHTTQYKFNIHICIDIFIVSGAALNINLSSRSS